MQQDAEGSFPVDEFLQTLLGKRVGRAFNTFASTDATYGLLPQITVSATSTSTSVPTLGELTDLQGAVNQAYLEADSAPVLHAKHGVESSPHEGFGRQRKQGVRIA